MDIQRINQHKANFDAIGQIRICWLQIAIYRDVL